MKIVEIITESGMPQIWNWMRKSPFIIMSGWRDNLTRQVNRERNRHLIQQIRKIGLSATEQKGLWEGGHKGSLFIPCQGMEVEAFIALAKRLMIEYDQDSVIVNDGRDTHMIWNEAHGTAPSYLPVGRMGNDIRVYGSREKVDAPAWSQKGNYRYTIVDKNKENSNGISNKSSVPR